MSTIVDINGSAYLITLDILISKWFSAIIQKQFCPSKVLGAFCPGKVLGAFCPGITARPDESVRTGNQDLVF